MSTVIPKSNFKFSNVGFNILKIAFLTMNQINNIRRIARRSLSNNIFFVSLGAGKCFRSVKELRTKITS